MTEDKPLVLQLHGGEIAALKAVLASGLDETGRTDGPDSGIYYRLDEMQRQTNRLTTQSTLRLPLERDDVELLRAYAALVIGMHGYVAGRPDAIAGLTSLRTKLDRLLKGSRWHEMHQRLGEIMRIFRT